MSSNLTSKYSLIASVILVASSGALVGCNNQEYFQKVETSLTGNGSGSTTGIPTPTPAGTTTGGGATTGGATTGGATTGGATTGGGSTTGSSGTPTPTPAPCLNTSNLRIMFMVDNSGSTTDSTSGGVTTKGTDTNHTYRSKTVQTFINNYGQYANLTYSFGYFADTSASEFDMLKNKFESPASSFFGPASQIYSTNTSKTTALSVYDAITPAGYTPYGAAFTALANEIKADGKSGNNYVVIFMSDGQPTDLCGSTSVTSCSQVPSELATYVGNLNTAAAANNAQVTVSTVYFGPNGDTTTTAGKAAATAIGYLQGVASVGKGVFLNTNTSTDLTIANIIAVPGGCPTK